MHYNLFQINSYKKNKSCSVLNKIKDAYKVIILITLYSCILFDVMKKTNKAIPLLKIEDIIEPDFSELVVLKQQEKGKNKLLNSHKHDFYLVLFIASGSGIHNIDAKDYKVTDRRLFFVAPGQTHSWNMDEQTLGYQLFFKANFITNHVLMSEWPIFKQGNFPYIDVSVVQYELIFNEINQLQQEIENKEAYSTRILNHRLTIMLTLLSRWYHNQWSNHDILSAPHRLIERFSKLLESSYHIAGNVQFYADKLFVTPSYLNTITKRVLGQKVGVLIRERRLLEAKRMLAITTMDVQEIAFFLGYNELAYFSHFFKKHVGVSPSTFRNSNLHMS